MGSFRSSVEPVLGTRLTMRVDCADRDVARRAEEVALAVADRLEAILTAHRPDSAFRQWRRGDLRHLPRGLKEVLSRAADWHDRTDGAFNPCLGRMVERWRRAQTDQVLPDAGELAALATTAARLPFTIRDGDVVVLDECDVVDVQGIAKGWVIDRMVEAVAELDGVGAVMVDLGGDLRHASKIEPTSVRVAVEDPFVVADNARPLTTVALANAAMATSGGGRRGWRIDGRWYGHLLDPATGWPLAHQRSCTVVAPEAVDADAAASAFSALNADEAERLSARLGTAVLIVGDDGQVWRSHAWLEDVDERSVDGDPHQDEGHH